MKFAKLLSGMALLLIVSGSSLAQNPIDDVSKSAAPKADSVDVKQQSAAPAAAATTHDPLLDLPPLKAGQTTLIGGTVESIDIVRDRLVLRPFGAHKLEIAFDPRTSFIGGTEGAGAGSLRKGDVVHIETTLDGTRVFAKAIHLASSTAVGEARGQVLAYDAPSGRLTIRDELSSRPVQFTWRNDQAESLLPGALVRISFQPNADRTIARDVKVLAAPGATFTFAGRITFLDLATHELVVENATDNNKYQIQFDAALAQSQPDLREGIDVVVSAKFDGQNYTAQSLTVTPAPKQ